MEYPKLDHEEINTIQALLGLYFLFMAIRCQVAQYMSIFADLSYTPLPKQHKHKIVVDVLTFLSIDDL